MKTTEKLQSAVRCITLLVLLILSVTQGIGQEKEVALALQEGRKPGLPYLLRVETKGFKKSSEKLKNKTDNYLKKHNFVIISSEQHSRSTNGASLTVNGVEKLVYIWYYEIIPESEKAQYDQEVETRNKGGLLDYTPITRNIPTDAKTLKQAKVLYKKGHKLSMKWNKEDEAYQNLHAAAMMGNAMAKVEEAKCFEEGNGTKKDRLRAQQLADEAVLSDDPAVWKAASGMLSKRALAYVAWRQDETKPLPWEYITEYKGVESFMKELRESAEKGVTTSQKGLAIMLWNVEKNRQAKQEAVKWLSNICENDHEVQDYLIVAKGEGLYNNAIPEEWYKHTHNDLLYAAAKQGNKEAQLAQQISPKPRKLNDGEFVIKTLADMWVGACLALQEGYQAALKNGADFSGSGSSSDTADNTTDSNTADPEETYSCRVHLTFRDGDEVYKGHGSAFFKGFLNTTHQSYETDKNGYATITWPKYKGEIINCLTLDRNIGFNDAYTKEGLELKDGGTYTICMDCK